MSRRFVATVFACLLAALSARANPQAVRLAVLEFEVSADLKIDRTYFSDLARGAVHRATPQIFVMTRESTEALLNASGRTMNDCTGECEIEVGRKLGADYIVSGRITQIGSRLSLTMRLFSTADGQLLESVEARGKSADELLDHSDSAMETLVAPLKKALESARAEAVSSNNSVATTPPPAPAPIAKPYTPPPAPLVDAKPIESKPAEAAQTPAPAPAAAPVPVAAAPENTKPLQLIAENKDTNLTHSNLKNSDAGVPPEAIAIEAKPPMASHVKLGWAALGAGALLAGGSAAFDNLSSTSKDNKLTAADFIPIAGYAIAAALGGFGVYQIVRQ